MTTEPFPPSSSADPADGTAAIVPVTPEMMDHAAHAAADRADAVAHGADDAIPEAQHDEPPPADPIPAVVERAAANENAAEAVPETGALQTAELAFTHGTAGGTSRAAAGSTDSLGRYNAKMVEIATENLSAAGELVSALLGAASLGEAAAINADHMRRRFDALTMQGRDLLILAQKVALDAIRSSHRS